MQKSYCDWQLFYSIEKAASVSKGRFAFSNFILRLWRCGRRRGRCAAVAAAGVNDDAGAFPCYDKSLAGIRAVELQGEVVHVGCQLHEGGHVGFHFAQQGALVDNLSARRVQHIAVGGDCLGVNARCSTVRGDCPIVNGDWWHVSSG